MITQRFWFTVQLLTCLLAGVFATGLAAQEGQSTSPEVREPVHLSFARFKIPFNIESKNSNIEEVQLWVSTDQGASWQMHGSAVPSEKHFEFQAAAEGLYFFSLQTVDAAGDVFPSPDPYMQVYIDTSKPQTALRADVSPTGQFVIEMRVADENLAPTSAQLRMRTDRSEAWEPIQVGPLTEQDGVHSAQVTIDLPTCREVGLAFTIADQAQNIGEASFQYTMPRTAGANPDLTLASSATPESAVPALQDAIAWNPTSESPPQAETVQGPGMLASRAMNERGVSESELTLSPASPRTQPEELPAPSPVEQAETEAPPTYVDVKNAEVEPSTPPRTEVSSTDPSGAYHCNSRSFSLDYSVDALGGTSLSDVELWGTEDGGRTWQKWGADPDRQSPFDVQVGNDGLFGFRMVIVTDNGMVSNRPSEGDSADMWINVDTAEPTAKIKRALYGQGDEEGMLVIDYVCSDGHLVDLPISLSYSESADGPWTKIAGGLSNSGIYLWKSTPHLPARVFLRMEVVDKAGNVGVDRLDAPISTKAMGPQGQIQGFRPIVAPK